MASSRDRIRPPWIITAVEVKYPNMPEALNHNQTQIKDKLNSAWSLEFLFVRLEIDA
jgi:hypothetical protein